MVSLCRLLDGRSRILIAGFGFLLLSDIAACQERAGRKEVFGEAGASFFTGNSEFGGNLIQPPGGGPFLPVFRESVFSKSFRLVGGGRYWLTNSDAIEATFSLSPNTLRVRSSLPQGGVSGFSTTVQTDARNVAVNYVRALPRFKRFEPFATIGLGAGFFRGFLDNETKLVLNFGAGGDMQLSPRWLLRFEVRDFLSGQPTADVLNAPAGRTHNIVPTAGVVFRF